jgi:hypothetical protein
MARAALGKGALRMRAVAATASLLVSGGVAIANPSSASAAVSPSFTIADSIHQADTNPTITANLNFSYSDSTDSAKNAVVTLPAGLLFNTTAATATCTPAQLTANMCPAASQIGTGSMVASTFLGNQSVAVNLFQMPPQSSSELARIGFFGSTLGNNLSGSAPVTASTAGGNIRLVITLSNLPNSAGGFAIQLISASLKINGTVDGHAFTRNPTNCANGSASLSVSTYEVATPVTAGASYSVVCTTPLPFAPQVSGVDKRDTADTGVAVTVSIAQNAGQSATHTAHLTLPPSLLLRSAVVTAARAAACKASALSMCPVIGTVKIITPLLKAPLTGTLYLVGAGASALPGITARFTGPITYQINGVTTSSSAGTTEALTLIDAPVSAAIMSFTGGINSLFIGSGLCGTAGKLKGAFTGYGSISTAPVATITCS